MGRRAIASFVTCVGLIVSSASVAVTTREQTEAIFGEILANAGSELRVLVNNTEEPDVKLGENFSFQFTGGPDGYLTVLYLDAHGNAMLLFPTDVPEAAHLKPGTTITYPPPGKEVFAAQPLGFETVFAVSTPSAISAAALGMKTSPGALPTTEYDQVPAMVRTLASLVKGSFSAARSHHRVIHRNAPTRGADSEAIVEFFTGAITRGRVNPKIDLDIKFAFSSAVLTQQAKTDLDEVGLALIDPRLARSKFLLIGHTDSVGSDADNLTLSKRRAAASRSYLVGQHPRLEKRVRFEGRGEQDPLIPSNLGYSIEYTQSQNRRVTVQLTR